MNTKKNFQKKVHSYLNLSLFTFLILSALILVSCRGGGNGEIFVGKIGENTAGTLRGEYCVDNRGRSPEVFDCELEFITNLNGELLRVSYKNLEEDDRVRSSYRMRRYRIRVTYRYEGEMRDLSLRQFIASQHLREVQHLGDLINMRGVPVFYEDSSIEFTIPFNIMDSSVSVPEVLNLDELLPSILNGLRSQSERLAELLPEYTSESISFDFEDAIITINLDSESTSQLIEADVDPDDDSQDSQDPELVEDEVVVGGGS